MKVEDTDKLFENAELLICDASGKLKPLGPVVRWSTSFESEEESDYVPTKKSYSFSCEMPSLSQWFREHPAPKPVIEAQKMLDRLGDYQALWRKYFGFGMRRERRKIERNYNALLQRFLSHCEHYGITIKQN